MNDIEMLRSMFKDISEHICVGVVTQLGLSADSSRLRVLVKLLPDQRELVCFMTFADVYDVTFPELNDLVLIAIADDDIDNAYVIKVLNNSEEPIPTKAVNGDTVKYSRPGKKLYLGSDTKVLIGKTDSEGTEPLVLGTVLKNALTAFLDDLLNASQIGWSAAGPVFLDPGVRANLVAHKATYVTNAATNILSQIGYTERGN